MASRLEPKRDGYYENTMNEPPMRPPRKFLNPSFNTSNSLFVQENEPLEVRLMSPYEKLNMMATPNDRPHPAWFNDQHDLLNDLAEIQLEQTKWPTVAPLGSNIIRNQFAMSPPTDIAMNDLSALRSLLSSLNTKAV